MREWLMELSPQRKEMITEDFKLHKGNKNKERDKIKGKQKNN